MYVVGTNECIGSACPVWSVGDGEKERERRRDGRVAACHPPPTENGVVLKC
jgi:hypothetical protein